MTYPWYSGSDTSGEVAEGLSRFAQSSDSWTTDQRVKFLQSLIKKEQDPNWLARFHHYLGAEHLLAGDRFAALEYFLMAEDMYSPLLGSFPDVSGSFCRNRFEIIREKLVDAEDDALIQIYSLSILCWKAQDTFSEFEFDYLLSSLGYSLARSAEKSNKQLFDRLALEVRQRRLRVEGADLGMVYSDLFLSSLALKNREYCETALSILRQSPSNLSRAHDLQNMMDVHLGVD